MRALIAKKADVNAPQNDGATALHWAAFRSDLELAEMLLRAGANPKAANREGATPLWLASVNGDAAMIARCSKAGADANEKLPLGRQPADDCRAHRQCRGDHGAARSRAPTSTPKRRCAERRR